MGALKTHEDFSPHSEVKPPSERAFGITVAIVLAVVGVWPLVRHAAPRWWALAAALLLALAAVLWPRLLRPLNFVWTRLGRLIERVINPLITGAVFFLVVTPIAFIYRLVKKNPLGLRFDSAAESYWIERRPLGPAPESMRQQF